MVKKLIKSIYVLRHLKQTLPNSKKKYNQLFLSGSTNECISSYYYFKKKNSNLKLNIYEEGTNEYLKYKNQSKFKKIFSKIVYGRFYLDDCNRLFVYDPRLVILCPKHVEIVKIPQIRYLKEINTVFNYKKEFSDNYIGKYVFLEQQFSTTVANDLQKRIIKSIPTLLKNEMLCVKLHPLSNQDKYKECKHVRFVKTPYSTEVLRMNNSDVHRVIFTLYSSAAFNYTLVFGDNPHIILLYKLFTNIPVPNGLGDFIDLLKKNYPSILIQCPENINEFEEMVKQLCKVK